ncbi:type IVB secretion system protein IcmH/DotU [Thalassospiraceae bacterium SW-3-3]|nr:type IVB secretion system protein IcmH/DotU [Thalassospiraceae bacterium SW-3-3]
MSELTVTGFSQRPSIPDAYARSGHSRAGSPSAAMLMRHRDPIDFELRSNKAKNRLLEAAVPLMGLSVRIRNLYSFEDVEELHNRLINEIPVFQQELEGHGYDDATVLAARYVLCSMIDEAVLSQVWGAESLWPERPMLSTFHNETWGGEKVFAILDRVMDEAHRFTDLLELLYYCIALGFEGKYHVMHNGQAKLDHLMHSIHTILEKQRGEAPEKLLNPEPNISDRKQTMAWRMPVWAIAVIGMIMLVTVHVVYDLSLGSEIDVIADDIEASLGTKLVKGQ